MGGGVVIVFLILWEVVPLTGLLRRYVAFELERLWLPKRELAKTYRQRQLKHLENLLFLAKWSRKNKVWSKAGRVPPQSTALEAVANCYGSPAALHQFLKRERRVKKKPRR